MLLKFYIYFGENTTWIWFTGSELSLDMISDRSLAKTCTVFIQLTRQLRGRKSRQAELAFGAKTIIVFPSAFVLFDETTLCRECQHFHRKSLNVKNIYVTYMLDFPCFNIYLSCYFEWILQTKHNDNKKCSMTAEKTH
jgi:hypothetical protein